jgi:hypothetical protein
MKLTTALIAYKHLVGLKINHNELRERYWVWFRSGSLLRLRRW